MDGEDEGNGENMCRITLTECQKHAFERVKTFFRDDEAAIVIKGSAGSGKSFSTKYIADWLADTGNASVAAVAPTHKARRVLSKMLNKGRFIPIASMTVASILGKMREHSYIGSHKYTNGSRQKMNQYDVFILDEVSMVCDSDLEAILTYICEHNKKIILIGDDSQIPAPSQQIVKDKAICYKPNSYAFSLENVCELREIVRQQQGSIILQIATFLRDNIDQELDLADILSATGVDPGEVCIELDELYDQFVEDYTSGMDTRIIAYTNAAVRSHNTNVRKALGYDEPLVIGELLTGYTNIGFPVVVLENGSDYKVTSIKPIRGYSIAGYDNLCGKLVDIVDMEDASHVSRDLFFISITHPENAKFLTEFVRRAEKVNMRGSTKNDFKDYCALKNKCIFLENIYKFGETILTETDMKQQHPLLFTKVSDVIDTKTRAIAISELTRKLEDMYGEIVECRLLDSKLFGDGETFSDAYMIVELGCYYGYAATSHKTQGSTYDSAYVIEDDFRKITNRWNYRVRAVEQRHIERNQLRYVAYTRPSKKLRIVV